MIKSFFLKLLFLLIGLGIAISWSFSRSGFIDSIYFKPSLITIVFFFLGVVLGIYRSRLSVLDTILLLFPSVFIASITYVTFKEMFFHDLPLLPFWAILCLILGFKQYTHQLLVKRALLFISLIVIVNVFYGATISRWDYFINSASTPKKNIYAEKIDHTLLTKDSSVVHLSDYKDKIILLDFYTNNCKPCVKQLPRLKKLANKFSTKDFEVLLINTGMLDKYETIFNNKYFTNKGFDNLYDNEGLLSSYLQIEGVPQQYLLDRQGNIIHHTSGGSTNLSEEFKYQKLEELITENLAN